MQRIVDGILFEGNVVEGAWEVRTWRANGVTERTVGPCYEWREVGVGVPPLDPWDKERDADLLAERQAFAKRKNAKRAKTECRRLIIEAGLDELLTITYRRNQTDRKLCKRHFKEWVRRMRRALGGTFTYVASFERQERGAMHVHVACRRLPVHAQHRGVKVQGWRLGTEIWRSIVGEDNGLVFVGGKTRFGAPSAVHRSLAQLAAYVSKYILKDWEDVPTHENRYSRSDDIEVSEVQRERVTGLTFAEVIALSFECAEGDVVVSHRINRWKDAVWLCTDRRRPRHGPHVGRRA